MIKLFRHFAIENENAGTGLKNDLLYQQITTGDGYKLSLAAILPLVKHNRTAAEAYLDDSIMDFCVKTGALQPKDGVLYARS